jgi:hypothetical protein
MSKGICVRINAFTNDVTVLIAIKNSADDLEMKQTTVTYNCKRSLLAWVGVDFDSTGYIHVLHFIRVKEYSAGAGVPINFYD